MPLQVILPLVLALRFLSSIASAEKNKILQIQIRSGPIALRVLHDAQSQNWLCRAHILADEGAIIAFSSSQNMSAENVNVSIDHDLVFLDNRGAVVDIARDVPQTMTVGGPAAPVARSPKNYTASAVIILRAGRSTAAGITRAQQLVDLSRITRFDPPAPPCLAVRR